MTSPLVYTAQSKRYFYCRDAVCQFVLSRGAVPLNPFRMFDYFLGDRVARDRVRAANRRVLEICDEVWVFGTDLADGVLVEIAQATELSKDIRYFTIGATSDEIRAAASRELAFEDELRCRLESRLEQSRDYFDHDPIRLVQAIGRTSELTGA